MSSIYSYDFDRDRRLTAINFPSGRQILYQYSPALLTRTLMGDPTGFHRP